MPIFNPQRRYQYAPFYCEENIWHLTQHADFSDFPRQVLLISNAARRCAMWRQKVCRDDRVPVCWDYHAVLLIAREDDWHCADLDSRLPFPLPLHEYLRQTFLPLAAASQWLAPKFRLLAGDTYCRLLSSDRSHMRDDAGRWLVAPPPWPRIGDGEPNLMRLIDMDDALAGTRLDLSELELMTGLTGTREL